MRGIVFIIAALALVACDNARSSARPEPLPVVATATAAATTATPRTYTVQSGDGWLKIANDNGVALPDLLAANDATVDTVIHPGQTVLLPTPGNSPRLAAPTPPPTATYAPQQIPEGNFIPYQGNGGGPTLCGDGTYSHSSGGGTCSHHGGVSGGGGGHHGHGHRGR